MNVSGVVLSALQDGKRSYSQHCQSKFNSRVHLYYLFVASRVSLVAYTALEAIDDTTSWRAFSLLQLPQSLSQSRCGLQNSLSQR